MDYDQLIGSKSTAGSIANWINDSTVPAVAPTIVGEAESFIYRRLRHWRMLVPPVTGTLVVGTDQMDLPDDLLEPNDFYLTGNYFAQLDQKPEAEVISYWAFDSAGARIRQQPACYFFNQSYIQFDSPPDRAYSYALTYFQQPPALSESNTTNFLTRTYPRLVRCACMIGACEFKKDSGQGNFDRTYWEGLAEQEIEIAQKESDRAKRATVAGAILIGGGGTQAPWGF